MWIYQRRSRWPCPQRWRSLSFLEATELTSAGEGGRRQVGIEDGQLVLDIPAGVPHRLSAPPSADA